MKILGLLIADLNKFIFSRAHYDCRTFEGYMIDGGQPWNTEGSHYCRQGYPTGKDPGVVTWVELLGDVKSSDLHNDWNFRHDKYGIHDLSEVRVLGGDEVPNPDDLDWRVENAFVPRQTEIKKGVTHRYVNLLDCDLDFLQKILVTNKGVAWKEEIIQRAIELKGGECSEDISEADEWNEPNSVDPLRGSHD